MAKRVAVINDLSGLGKCSLTAAIPVLSVMGVQPCPLPTAVLTNQTGYESYYCDDYTDKISHYTREWQKRGLTLDGIYTGYLGSEAQVGEILRFCEIFRKKDTLMFVDPVMGDLGSVYPVFTPGLMRQMKRLVAHADVITPNLTECCLLTGTDYQELTSHAGTESYLDRISQMARPLLNGRLRTVIITGIIHKKKEQPAPCYYNMVLEKNNCQIVSSPVCGESYSGTGDLLASVVCAGMVNGMSAYDCTKKAIAFLDAALKETVAAKIPRNDGLNFEPYLSMLLPEKQTV